MDDMNQFARTMARGAEAGAMRRAPARAARHARSGADRRRILTQTVELDVIPRMLMAKRGVEPAASPVPSVVVVTSAEVALLADITLGGQEAAIGGFVAAISERGVTAEALYLDLLAPAARRLGDLWEQDICDFMEVTIGIWGLQNAMRDLGHAFLGSSFLAMENRRPGPRALLVPLPGEQHTFGLSMVYEFFRRGGWSAWSGPIADRDELSAMLRGQWVDVVGFSLACDDRLETARDEIRAVRRASRNPGVAILVGGPPFVACPGLAAEIGADGTAENGPQAETLARALLRRDHERH